MYNLCMMLYPRFIEPKIKELLDHTPVIIIEGARAVGKTSLIKKLRADGTLSEVHSMTDDETRKIVESDPANWLRSRTWPCAIDEAQLVPSLPLALKQIMDETGDGIRIILTGSASIGQTGLGGTDPLARRARRLSLEPLSEAEIITGQRDYGSHWSLVDHLFDSDVLEGDEASLESIPELALKRGGMPKYRVSEISVSDRNFNRQIDEDTMSILTQQVVPGQNFDQIRASEILSYVLRHPACQLNVSEIGRELEMDRRTIDSYLDTLEKRFLIYEVPNFNRPTKKSIRSSAKFFPADISLSTHALTVRCDKNFADTDTQGRLTETHVVQQLRAHSGWSHLDVQMFHWRQTVKSRTAEIDVVLQDSAGRLVAIEVKSSSNIKANHLKGLKDFKSTYPDKFHRGFLVTNSPKISRISEDIWAIPINSFYDDDIWLPSQDFYSNSTTEDEPQQIDLENKENYMHDAQIFVSYVHADAESAVGGDMRQFARDIAEALETLYGREIKLFLDVDRTQWGENLWDRLDAELRRSTFFIPFITPRYLKSLACKTEFTKFLDAAERAGVEEQLLLPLIWIYPPEFKKDSTNDLITSRIKKSVYKNVSSVRSINRNSGEYRSIIEDLAENINIRIDEMESAAPTPSQELIESTVEDEKGALEYFADIEQKIPDLQISFEDFMKSFTSLGEGLQEKSKTLDTLPINTPAQAQMYFRKIAHELSPIAQDVENKSSGASKLWESIFQDLNRGVMLFNEASDSFVPSSLIHSAIELRQVLVNIDGISEIETIALQMPQLSSSLKPISRAFLSSIRTINSMIDSIDSWLEAIGYEEPNRQRGL